MNVLNPLKKYCVSVNQQVKGGGIRNAFENIIERRKKNRMFFHSNNGNARITNGSSGIGSNRSNRFNPIYGVNQLQPRTMNEKKKEKNAQRKKSRKPKMKTNVS